MTEQLLSSNPSPVFEEKKTKKKCRRSWGRLTWSCCCFRVRPVQSLWFQRTKYSGLWLYRGRGATDALCSHTAFTWKTSEGWIAVRVASAFVSTVATAGWSSALWIPKQRGNEKTYWVFLSTSNLSIWVGGGSSFYLRGWEELQRCGGELINPPLCLQLSFEN